MFKKLGKYKVDCKDKFKNENQLTVKEYTASKSFINLKLFIANLIYMRCNDSQTVKDRLFSCNVFLIVAFTVFATNLIAFLKARPIST